MTVSARGGSWSLGLVLCLSLAVNPSARAEEQERAWSAEVFVGQLFPDDPTLDDAASYGLRVGYTINDRFGIQGSLSYFGDEGTIPDLKVAYDYDLWMVDLSFLYHFNPEDRAVFSLLVGPGWASTELSDVAVGENERDALTAHLGANVRVGLSTRTFVRFDSRGRWLEDSNDIDLEATVAFGFSW